MSGKTPHLNPLESRKLILVAESELNRAQLGSELAALKAHLRGLTDRARSLGSIASAAAVLFTGLAAFQRGRSLAPGAKSSWLKTILKGVGLISILWLAIRPPGRDPRHE